MKRVYVVFGGSFRGDEPRLFGIFEHRADARQSAAQEKRLAPHWIFWTEPRTLQ